VLGAPFDHRWGGGEGAPGVSSIKVVDRPLALSSRDNGLEALVRLRPLSVILGKQV